jgi:alkanesulfonate monooxygenase SsuD/methylene tetrahydromethanopterin reductase-like flavin-dependent oxidoreductase (luciferase family)
MRPDSVTVAVPYGGQPELINPPLGRIHSQLVRLELVYEMWNPPFAEVPLAGQYAAMLDQCAYADRHGFERVFFSEHHGTTAGYLPSPLTAAAAVTGRTRNLRTRTLLLTPFYHPIKLAEDIAVVDLLGGGRMEPVLGGGYRSVEYQMFGRSLSERRRAVDSTAEFLRRAWTGAPVELDGRIVQVTPQPVQDPHPPIMLAGNSDVSARAAARLADGFFPSGPPAPKVWEVYRQERVRLGEGDPGPIAVGTTPFLHVTEDPERDWPRIAPFWLAAIAEYRSWLERDPVGGAVWPRFRYTSEHELRRSPEYRLVTPDDCVAMIAAAGADASVSIAPGWGGVHPDLAWSSLELLVDRVLPCLRGRVPGAARPRTDGRADVDGP